MLRSCLIRSAAFASLLAVISGGLQVESQASHASCCVPLMDEVQQGSDEPISIILMLKSPTTIKAEQLAQVCGRVVNRPFSTGSKPNEKPDTVSMNDAGYLIHAREFKAVLTVGSKPWDHQLQTDQIDSAEIRTMLKEHKGSLQLSLLTSGSIADSKAEGGRTGNAATRTLCRIAAALCDDQTLGLAIPSQEILVAGTEDLPPLLNSANPIKALQTGVADTVVGASNDDPELSKASAEAKKRWSEFAKAHNKPPKGAEGFAAQFAFDAAEGRKETLWIEVLKIDANEVQGKVANEPQHVSLKLGESVKVPLSRMTDWLYYQDGERIGGFTVDVLLKRDAQKKTKPESK